jgi:hypothetical protein
VWKIASRVGSDFAPLDPANWSGNLADHASHLVDQI